MTTEKLKTPVIPKHSLLTWIKREHNTGQDAITKTDQTGRGTNLAGSLLRLSRAECRYANKEFELFMLVVVTRGRKLKWRVLSPVPGRDDVSGQLFRQPVIGFIMRANFHHKILFFFCYQNTADAIFFHVWCVQYFFNVLANANILFSTDLRLISCCFCSSSSSNIVPSLL